MIRGAVVPKCADMRAADLPVDATHIIVDIGRPVSLSLSLSLSLSHQDDLLHPERRSAARERADVVLLRDVVHDKVGFGVGWTWRRTGLVQCSEIKWNRRLSPHLA